MRRRFYVTIQLSNGGIESLVFDFEKDEVITPEAIEDKIINWWDMNCPYMILSDKYVNMHIISWSLMEFE